MNYLVNGVAAVIKKGNFKTLLLVNVIAAAGNIDSGRGLERGGPAFPEKEPEKGKGINSRGRYGAHGFSFHKNH